MNDKVTLSEYELYLLKRVEEMKNRKNKFLKPTPRNLLKTTDELKNNPTLQNAFKRLGI